MSLANEGTPDFEDVGKGLNNKNKKDATASVDAIVDSIVHAPKESPKVQRSHYLDVDVAKAFDKFGKKHGKGAKSNLINSFLRKALKDYM